MKHVRIALLLVMFAVVGCDSGGDEVGAIRYDLIGLWRCDLLNDPQFPSQQAFVELRIETDEPLAGTLSTIEFRFDAQGDTLHEFTKEAFGFHFTGIYTPPTLVEIALLDTLGNTSSDPSVNLRAIVQEGGEVMIFEDNFFCFDLYVKQ